MEYFADGNKDPRTVPWSPLKCTYSVSEKGGEREREPGRETVRWVFYCSTLKDLKKKRNIHRLLKNALF